MNTRARIILLLVLLVLDVVAAILVYEAAPRIEPGVPGASGLCASTAYVVRFPRGLGPWNTVLIARNLSTDEYQLPVLVPWPLHEARVWGSSATGWATIGGGAARPLLYGDRVPGPVMVTLYTWSPGDTWLAILPCKARGFNSTELGKARIIARSEPVDGTVFEAVQPSKIYVANAIPLPLGSSWTHIILLTSPRHLAGLVQLPGDSAAIERLRELVKGEVALKRSTRLSPSPFEAYMDREGIPFILEGRVTIEYLFTSYRLSFGGLINPAGGFYLYKLPRDTVGYDIYSMHSERKYLHSLLGSIYGHVDILGLALAPVSDIAMDLRANVSRGDVLAWPPVVGEVLPSSTETSCMNITSLEAIIPNKIPVNRPGITIPVYLIAYRFASLRSRDTLIVRVETSSNTEIEVLVNGFPVCSGIGRCSASLAYPWLYVVMLESILSAEPLEVSILANGSTTLTGLDIAYRKCVARVNQEEPREIVTLEPINPSTLSPTGLVIVIKWLQSKIDVLDEALGNLALDLRGARINATRIRYLYITPSRSATSLPDKLLEPHINWIERWEPFLATLDYAARSPFVALRGDELVINSHGMKLLLEISYVSETSPVLLLAYSAPGVEKSVVTTSLATGKNK